VSEVGRERGFRRHRGERVGRNREEVRVEIYDQAYDMRGELDPDYIRHLARFVDGKMRSIASRTRHVDSLRVAILTALNIADECHQLKAKMAQAEQKASECSNALDELLEAR
jgi:cell division protein ZapA